MSEMFGFALQRDNLYSQVADRIQELIVAQSLRPGDRLPGERELAEQMGISRTVVREAIRVLSVRGLVKTKPGCGTYIRELHPRDMSASVELFFKLQQPSIRDVYQVRRMIEVEVAGLAAERAGDEDIQVIQETIDRMRCVGQDVDQFVQLDLDFHLALAAATHNDLFALLLHSVANLWQQVIRLSYQIPDAVQDALYHHQHVLDQIRQHDVSAARQAMLEHIDRSLEMIEAVHRQMESQRR